MDEDGFVIVRHSKKVKNKIKSKKNQSLVNIAIELNSEERNKAVDEKKFCSKIKQLEIELWDSEFFKKFINSVLVPHGLVAVAENQSTKQQGPYTSANRISKIICLGLGGFTSSKQAEYQLVFLNCLVKVLDLKQLAESVLVFDPVHSHSEINILRDLGFNSQLHGDNLEGKYNLREQSLEETLFYLPHCPKQLTNNILWANWNPEALGSAETKSSDKQLQGLHILGNSFDRIVSTLPDRILKEIAVYILHASNFVLETKVENCFKYTDIFNDTSLHSFPFDQLPSSEDPVWKIAIGKDSPAYEEDAEFITKTSG